MTAAGDSAQLISSAFDAFDAFARRDVDALLAVLDPDWEPRLEDVKDMGDAAVVRFHVTATGRESGVRIDHEYWMGVELGGGT